MRKIYEGRKEASGSNREGHIGSKDLEKSEPIPGKAKRFALLDKIIHVY